jgi:peptidoglycan hydrolase CwlO-like protein
VTKSFKLRWRVLAIALLSAFACAAVVASSGRADLASRYSTHQHQAGQLQSTIQTDSTKIHGFEGSIASLQGRLAIVQRSLAVQERLLGQVREDLGRSRRKLTSLRAQYAKARRVLAAQLVADYETPPPTIVDVVVTSGGFQDLLNRVSDLKSIAHANGVLMYQVNVARIAVAAQARRLAAAERRRRQSTAAVLSERDDIVQLRLSIVNRELPVQRDRSAKQIALTKLQRTLSAESAALDRQAAAAAASAAAAGPSITGGVPPSGGCVNTSFVPHGGEFGFFPAAGTNYSVNQEPIIAARLDVLGRALQLHLIGVSGYRSPQHSVEVGGFADDPHTRGEASDTPGVEGVPEGTLERFCLTRPFGGAREADHIQLL